MDCESDLHKKVKAALYEFFCKDRGLLELNVNERSISHKLAEYLQPQFEGLQVDCEYNRREGEVKRLNCLQPEETRSDDRDAKTVYPDIIVHRRGNDDSNLLVIELKKLGAGGVSHDKKKLRAFTDPQCGYNYRLGILLVFDVSNQSLSWAACFREGEECECAFCKSLKGLDGK